jgi:hypothetical protein
MLLGGASLPTKVINKLCLMNNKIKQLANSHRVPTAKVIPLLIKVRSQVKLMEPARVVSEADRSLSLRKRLLRMRNLSCPCPRLLKTLYLRALSSTLKP